MADDSAALKADTMLKRSDREKQRPSQPDSALGEVTPHHVVLQLQRTAGNAATARALALQSLGGRPHLAVQRTPGPPLIGLGLLMILLAAFGAEAMVEAMARTRQFARLFRGRTGRWPSEVEWNAWGHCYVGYRMTTLSGGRLAQLTGTAKEYFHSALASIPGIGRIMRHNSLREDLHNQSVGITAASQPDADGDPMTFSLDALCSGQLQVAPPDAGEQDHEIQG